MQVEGTAKRHENYSQQEGNKDVHVHLQNDPGMLSSRKQRQRLKRNSTLASEINSCYHLNSVPRLGYPGEAVILDEFSQYTCASMVNGPEAVA